MKREKKQERQEILLYYRALKYWEKINLELAVCPARTSVYFLTRILVLVSGGILTRANTLTP